MSDNYIKKFNNLTDNINIQISHFKIKRKKFHFKFYNYN